MKAVLGMTKSHQYTALFIAAVTIITAGSFTTLAGLLTIHFAQDLGWSTVSISSGIAINMVLYGAAAPFSIYAMEKYGIRKITIIALLLLMSGALLSLFESVLLFNISWGVIVGFGCGALTMAYGALIARVWFDEVGLATGILTASAVLGQFVLLPLWAFIAEAIGWQYTLIGCALLASLSLFLNIFFMTEKYTKLYSASRARLEDKGGVFEVFDILQWVVKNKVFWLIAV